MRLDLPLGFSSVFSSGFSSALSSVFSSGFSSDLSSDSSSSSSPSKDSLMSETCRNEVLCRPTSTKADCMPGRTLTTLPL